VAKNAKKPKGPSVAEQVAALAKRVEALEQAAKVVPPAKEEKPSDSFPPPPEV
jgi:hypothetical protein